MKTEHIIASLENRLSTEDQRAFDDLLQTSPEFRKEVNEVRFIWETTTKLKLQKQIDTSRNWKIVSRRIIFDQYKNKFWRFTRTMAAILFLPVLLASYILFDTLKEWNNIPIEQLEQTSAYGLISKITLSDGSEIWLNSGSSLSYPKRFTGNKRKVMLSGEAYFKVSSNKRNRFDVATPSGLIVSAYGTEFNINAYDDENKIETTLAQGNIEVSQTSQPSSRVLHPGEQVVFYKETNKMEVEKVNLVVETAWKDGKMIFRRANMNEIAERLARHFNVTVQLEGEELNNYEYSATFTTETLSEILQLLEKTAPIKCKIIEPRQSADLSYSKRTVIIQTIK